MAIAVRDKAENQRRFRLGMFGNVNPDWASPAAALASGYRGLLMVRSTKPGSKWCKANLTPTEAVDHINEAVNSGENRSQFYVSAMLTDQEQHTTIQGEVCRSPEGLTLNYTWSKKPMRLALKEQSLHASGVKAKILLQQSMDPSSYQDLMDLLDEYSDCPNKGYPTSHVIEFTTFDIPVGDTSGRNTIIWEVRAY